MTIFSRSKDFDIIKLFDESFLPDVQATDWTKNIALIYGLTYGGGSNVNDLGDHHEVGLIT